MSSWASSQALSGAVASIARIFSEADEFAGTTIGSRVHCDPSQWATASSRVGPRIPKNSSVREAFSTAASATRPLPELVASTSAGTPGLAG